MRNAVRALQAMIAAGAALILVAPAAQANVLDEIVVAHRAGATAKYGEGTLKSYKFSVANHADILDGDIHWTKDSPKDSDKLGTILVIHDSTLDRITNCKGKVSSWRWGSIRDKCRTDHGKQPLIRLKDLIAYGKSSGKQVAIGLKNGKISNAQAKDLWNTIKSSNVQLEAPASRLAALNKVKKLDKADPQHKIIYALTTTRVRRVAFGLQGEECRHLLARRAIPSREQNEDLQEGRHQGVSVHRQERVRLQEDGQTRSIRRGSQ